MIKITFNQIGSQGLQELSFVTASMAMSYYRKFAKMSSIYNLKMEMPK